MQHFSFNKSFEENKLVYRQLVKKMHPDKGGSNADFLELSNQWEFYKLNHKNVNTQETKNAFDEFTSKVNFAQVKDVEVFYEQNKDAIHEIAKRFLMKKKNNALDDELIKFGFKLGKSIFDIFK